MIKAIIFDFGGPIVEWKTGRDAVYTKHEDHRNLERDTFRKFFEPYARGGNIGEFDTVADFIEKTHPSINLTVEELNEIFNEAKAAMYIQPDMVAYIEELKKKKYQIALLSNFTSGIEKFLQDIFKIYHLFDVVVSSYNVKMKKPDPRIYEYTLEKLGVKPTEAVFIDDVEENVKSAEAVGIQGIIFKNFEQCKSDLNKLLL
ncbi:MAG: HAD family phosphatase [Candidatus Taylorbacteria bacterium]|nr:HAD family phosphatase [Candidatus Taylorbacteria bacterium]